MPAGVPCRSKRVGPPRRVQKRVHAGGTGRTLHPRWHEARPPGGGNSSQPHRGVGPGGGW